MKNIICALAILAGLMPLAIMAADISHTPLINRALVDSDNFPMGQPSLGLANGAGTAVTANVGQIGAAVQTRLSSAGLLVKPSALKTVNGNSLIGQGDITVTGGGGITSITSSTPTTFGNGTILASSGTLLRAAVAGTDYLTPTGSAASLTNFPTLNQNTTGTAAGLSGTPALPNGTTATTQSQADNSTKLATTAYVDAGLAGKQAAGTYLSPTGNGSGLTGITASQVGLGNVNNTADSAKPVSTAQQTALNLKADLNPAEYAQTCTTTVTVNPATSQAQKITLGGNCTVSFTQPAAGTARILLKIIQGASTYTATWTSVKWPTATAPTITATAAAVDFVSCYLDGTATWCVPAQDFR